MRHVKRRRQQGARPVASVRRRLREGRRHRHRRHPARASTSTRASSSSAAEGGFGFCDVVFGWDSADECYDNGTYTGWQSGLPRRRGARSTCRRTARSRGRTVATSSSVTSSAATASRSTCARAAAPRRASTARRAWATTACSASSSSGSTSRETPAVGARQGLPRPHAAHARACSATRSCARPRTSRSSTRCSTDLRAFGVPLEGLHTRPGRACSRRPSSTRPRSRRPTGRRCSSRRRQGDRRTASASCRRSWPAGTPTLPGCSGHAHQSLWDADGERNLFFDDADEPHRMSDAVPLATSPASSALLPELLPLFWRRRSTATSDWSTASGRRPSRRGASTTARSRAGSSRDPPKSTRLEMRVPGSDVNPYLAVAAVLGRRAVGHRARARRSTARRPRAVPTPTTRSSGCRARCRRPPQRLAESKIARELFGDEVRRPLRAHARVGVAPVRRRRHRLGAPPLLRDHLTPNPPRIRQAKRAPCAALHQPERWSGRVARR